MNGPARVRRLGAALAAGALLVVLSACSGLPTTGPVNYGLSADETDDDAVRVPYVAEPPASNASPSEIVEGFLLASFDTAQSWAAARGYLADDVADAWNPSTSVLIDSSTERTVTGSDDPADATPEPEDGADDDAAEQESTATVSVAVKPEATLDADGRYTVVAGETQTLDYELTRNDAGQWRIAEAPDGIVIDKWYFQEIYAQHDLYYFDSTWTYLVPDARWFLAQSNTVNRVVQELVDGEPSDWLSSGAHSAFAGDVALTASASIDADGAARVELEGAGGSVERKTAERMLAQLEQSLADDDVRSVSLTVDGDEMDVEAAAVASTDIDSRPLVLTDEGFGFLAGGKLDPLAGLDDWIQQANAESELTSISVSSDHQTAVVQNAAGQVYRVTADDGPVRLDAGAVQEPALDPFGYVWTVKGTTAQSLTMWDAGATPTSMAGQWTDVTAVHAVAISRDGARIAALVSIGDEEWVIASAIQRDDTGRPEAIGPAVRVSKLSLSGVAIAWLDDATIGFVAGESERAVFTQQVVGAPGESTAATLDVAAIGAGNQETTARLLTQSGELSARRGERWAEQADGVLVLATQLGQPAE